MTDELIEKALDIHKVFGNCKNCPYYEGEPVCSTRLLRDVSDYINRLKANLESVVQSFTRMETLYKVKCKELEVAEERMRQGVAKEFVQFYDNETNKTVINGVPFTTQQMLVLTDYLNFKPIAVQQIRIGTAKEILQNLYNHAKQGAHDKNNDFAFACNQIKTKILAEANKYGVEVN